MHTHTHTHTLSPFRKQRKHWFWNPQSKQETDLRHKKGTKIYCNIETKWYHAYIVVITNIWHWPWTVCVRVKSLQSNPTLCDPTDCSPPDSSLHGILQARILECVAMTSSRGSSWPRDCAMFLSIPVFTGRFFFFTTSTNWEALGRMYIL